MSTAGGYRMHRHVTIKQLGFMRSPQPMEVEAEAEHLLGPAETLAKSSEALLMEASLAIASSTVEASLQN